jgi:rubrerythrin
MDFNSLTAIIDFAISQEQEAADFYRRIGEKEVKEGKKHLFLQFAGEEDQHRRILENLKSGDAGQSLRLPEHGNRLRVTCPRRQ